MHLNRKSAPLTEEGSGLVTRCSCCARNIIQRFHQKEKVRDEIPRKPFDEGTGHWYKISFIYTFNNLFNKARAQMFSRALGIQNRVTNCYPPKIARCKQRWPAKTSVSLRSSPLGTFPPRETSPAAKSEEKRMFSQATNKQEKKYTKKRTCPIYTAHKG